MNYIKIKDIKSIEIDNIKRLHKASFVLNIRVRSDVYGIFLVGLYSDKEENLIPTTEDDE